MRSPPRGSDIAEREAALLYIKSTSKDQTSILTLVLKIKLELLGFPQDSTGFLRGREDFLGLRLKFQLSGFHSLGFCLDFGLISV